MTSLTASHKLQTKINNFICVTLYDNHRTKHYGTLLEVGTDYLSIEIITQDAVNVDGYRQVNLIPLDRILEFIYELPESDILKLKRIKLTYLNSKKDPESKLILDLSDDKTKKDN